MPELHIDNENNRKYSAQDRNDVIDLADYRRFLAGCLNELNDCIKHQCQKDHCKHADNIEEPHINRVGQPYRDRQNNSEAAQTEQEFNKSNEACCLAEHDLLCALSRLADDGSDALDDETY